MYAPEFLQLMGELPGLSVRGVLLSGQLQRGGLMLRCGLLGETLGHSYSPMIHHALGGV